MLHLLYDSKVEFIGTGENASYLIIRLLINTTIYLALLSNGAQRPSLIESFVDQLEIV